MAILVLTLVLFTALVNINCADQECRPIKADHDSVMCTCDAGYCDYSEPEVPPPGGYLTITSNKDGLRFKKGYGYLELYSDYWDDCNNCRLDLAKQRLSLNIDGKKTFQKMLGFGTSFTDAAGINIASLSDDVQEKLLRAYFTSSGLDYNMGRVPIGGTDFSTRPYTLDDADDDPELRHFALQKEDHDYKIPYIIRARKMVSEELLLTSATWSPPLFMKFNKKFVGKSHLDKKYSKPYAQYHVRFLEEYKKQGVDFWSISPGNEPSDGLFSLADTVPTCGWLPDDMADWIIDYFGPAIRNSEFNKTKILILDDTLLNTVEYLPTMLKHKELVKYMDAVALHWYMDEIVNQKMLEKSLQKHPDVPIYTTEMSADKSVDGKGGIQKGAWSRAELYAKRILNEINHNSSAFIDWNFCLNAADGGPTWTGNPVDALILVDKDNNRFFKQPSYYSFGHFSKSIPRGSYRVEAKETTRSGLHSSAFLRPDGFITVIIHNSHDHPVYTTVNDGEKGMINIVLSPKSITTVMY